MTGEIIITNIRPQIDGGDFPAKRVVGDAVVVTASIFSYGTDVLKARIRYKHSGERKWNYAPLTMDTNDTWQGSFVVEETGFYSFSLETWVDEYGTWLQNLKKWFKAGEDVSQDLKVGIGLLRNISRRCKGNERKEITKAISKASSGSREDAMFVLESRKVLSIVLKRQKMAGKTSSGKRLKIHVERKTAGFSSWYELFPRSQGATPKKSGTFEDVVRRLDDIASMGFDVLYLTPIHPIGHTNRRGKDGSLKVKASDPGSPWAIGNESGGHKAIEETIGTLEDFRHLLNEAGKRGMEVAMDIAFQCSPDHPYVTDHPEWFYKRPDGTIRYAENPPKKYYDIYPINFGTATRKELYGELLNIFLYWADVGVKIFRVDNPHTKPFKFWEWIIKEVRKVHPDAIFLSEAFTRPKVMYRLSKIGFSQSYTYFTWRNYEWELKEYFSQLSEEDVADHFRPMLFTNTPDILPFILQRDGRSAFKLRAVLAATLSPLWGIYSGFELCENAGIPGKEEYLNSEKYEIKPRDWSRKGNIKILISQLNRIRKEHETMQENGNVCFHEANNPNILFYTRRSRKTGSVLMIAVNINPYETHEATLKVPTEMLGICNEDPYKVKDLLTGDIYTWQGVYNYVRLIPDERPAHILQLVS